VRCQGDQRPPSSRVEYVDLGTELSKVSPTSGSAVRSAGPVRTSASGPAARAAEDGATRAPVVLEAATTAAAMRPRVTRLNTFSGELEGFASEFVGTLAREGRL